MPLQSSHTDEVLAIYQREVRVAAPALSCCYVLQGKVWVPGLGKEPREVCVVKAPTPTSEARAHP